MTGRHLDKESSPPPEVILYPELQVKSLNGGEMLFFERTGMRLSNIGFGHVPYPPECVISQSSKCLAVVIEKKSVYLLFYGIRRAQSTLSMRGHF